MVSSKWYLGGQFSFWKFSADKSQKHPTIITSKINLFVDDTLEELPSL